MDATDRTRMGTLIRDAAYTLSHVRRGFNDPQLESRGADDLANLEVRRDGTPWGELPVRTYISIVSGLAAFAVDHLHACAQTMLDDVDFGPAVTARSAVEAAGRMVYLLDPDADVRTRVGRGYGLRLRGVRDTANNVAALAESEQKSRSAQLPTADSATRAELDANAERLATAVADAKASIQRVIDQMRVLGFKPHRDPKTRDLIGIDGFGQPSGPELAYKALAHLDVSVLEQMYPAWSSIAHSAYDALRNHLDVVDDGHSLARLGTTDASRIVTAGLAAEAVVHGCDIAISYFRADPDIRLRLNAEVLPEIRRLFIAAVDGQG